MPDLISNATWLAKKQMRDQWSAYLITAAYFAFMGAVLAIDESYTREFAHPVLMFILIQASLSSRYMTLKKDNDVVRHQIFLRSLPMPLRTTIVARLIAMLAAGVINVPIYFGMMWWLGDQDLTGPQFFGWSVLWSGIALIGTGLALVQEFWLTLRKWSFLNFSVVLFVLALLPVSIWLLDFSPVEDTLSAAANQPVLMAVTGLVLGISALVASVLIAERLYRKREFIT